MRLVNPSSGKCMDIAAAGTADGTNVQLWTCNGTVAQAFDLVRAANTAADSGDMAAAHAAAAAVFVVTNALGLTLDTTVDDVDEPTAALIAARNLARAEKNWAEADRLRDELQAMGWTVEDGAEGTTVHR